MGRPAEPQRLLASPFQAAKQPTTHRLAILNEPLSRRYEKQINVQQETAYELTISLAAAHISYEQQMADLAAEIRWARNAGNLTAVRGLA
jgi:hypothetical protein